MENLQLVLEKSLKSPWIYLSDFFVGTLIQVFQDWRHLFTVNCSLSGVLHCVNKTQNIYCSRHRCHHVLSMWCFLFFTNCYLCDRDNTRCLHIQTLTLFPFHHFHIRTSSLTHSRLPACSQMAFRPLRCIHIDVNTVQRLTNKISFIRLYFAELRLFVCEIILGSRN